MPKKIKIGSIGAAASLGAHLVPAVKTIAPSVSLGKAAAPAIRAVASAASTGTTSKAPSLAAAKRAQARTAERQRQKRVKQAKVNIGKQRRKLRQDAKPKKAQRVIHKLPSTEQLPAKLAVHFGKKYDVPPSLLMGQMKQESGFNPGAVSSAGAFGLSQFIPSTAQSYKVKPGTSRHAQRTQVRGQAHYMGDLLKQTGNVDSALSSYSGGYSQSAYNAPVEANAAAYKKLDRVAGVKGVKTAGAPKPLPGAWEGSKKAVLSKIPHIERAEGRGDKRTPAYNASVGGSPTSDHLTTNKSAYAADIPVNASVYHAIQKKLGLPQTATGEQTITKDGYRYQLIYGAQYGHGDHIHLGAEYVGTGDTAVSGTSSTYSAGATSGGTAGGYAPAGSPTGHGSVASRKRGSRSHRRDVAARKRRKTATRLISHYRSNLTKGSEAKPAAFTPTSDTRKLVKLT